MKNLQINEPCTENWAQMAATEKGAFCQKCTKEVIDFTGKSNAEIKQAFMNLSNAPVCGRIMNSQLDSFNAEAKLWQQNAARQFQSSFLFSMVVVFGLSLFSCSSKQEEKTILKMQETIAQTISQPEEVKETIEVNPAKAMVSIPAPQVVAEEYQQVPVIIETSKTPDSLYEQLDEFRLRADMDYGDHVTMGLMVYKPIDDCNCAPNYGDQLEYDENGVLIPKVFQSKAYPNPVVLNTTLQIGLPVDDFVDISLFDLSGKLIQPVFSGELKRGTHNYPVEMQMLPVGVYIFNIHSRNYSESVKVIKQ